MVGNRRPAWLGPMAMVATVSVTGIVINLATDLRTSVPAWTAVVVATAAGGVTTWATQSATSGRRVPQLTIVLGAAGCVLAITLGILAVVSASEDPETGPAAGPGTAGRVPPSPIQDVASHELVSSSDFCPTSDKIDLDTAHSGHGGQTQLGDYLEECRVEGGLAELVLEQDEVHGPGNVPLFSVPKPGEVVGHDECLDAATEVERLRNRLALDELRNGDAFCVRTDRGNIARVSVLDVSTGSQAHLTIAFTTWR